MPSSSSDQCATRGRPPAFRTLNRAGQRVRRGLRAGLGLWLALGLGSVPRAAAEEDKEKDKDRGAEDLRPRPLLDAVNVVSLRRTPVFDSPRAASAVERDELRERPPRTASDALSDEDGVFVTRPSQGRPWPVIRGLGGGHILLLVDGVRLNNTITSTLPGGLVTPNLLDPYLLDAVEIVRGPGLASYGSDGLGGTVQFRTRRPAPIAGSNIELNAGVRGAYSSYDQGLLGSVSGGGRWSRYALDTAFSVRRFGDLYGGGRAGTQPLTGYDEGALYVGLGADLGAGTLVVVFQGQRQYDGASNERSQPGDLYTLTAVQRDLGYLRYDGNFELRGNTIDVSATASLHRMGEDTSRQQLALDRLTAMSNGVTVLGINANVRADLGRGGFLSAGVEGYFEWVRSTATVGLISSGLGGTMTMSPELVRYPAGSGAQSFALFVQDELDLERLFTGAESARPGRLRALISGRVGGNFLGIGEDSRMQRLVPEFAATAQGARQIQTAVWAGSVHVQYQPVSALALFAGFSTGVRPANLDDNARLDLGRPGLLVPGTTALRPEAAYSGEAGLRVAHSRIEGGATYSITYLSDPLSVSTAVLNGHTCYPAEDRCTDRLLTRRNERSALIHAVEASARLNLLGGLAAYATVTYAHGDVQRLPPPGLSGQPAGAVSSDPLWRVPPLFGFGSLQLRRPRSLLSFAEIGVRWGLAQRRLSIQDVLDPTVCPPGQPSCDGTPGFLVVTARGALRLSRRLHVTGTIENLANETYRLHGSGVASPGLGAYIAMEGNY
ncbi:MAG: TonB-dependent receptor [Polyangia bacterium]